MLTIEEIKNIKFRKSNIGGYKAEDVDIFIDKVEESFRKLEDEREDLQEKLKILADKVCEYRETEESIKTTLLNAQKTADASLKEAKAESDRIIKQANDKYKEIVEKAERDILDQKTQLATIKQNIRDFRNNILNMYKEHIKQVNLFTADDRISSEMLSKLNQRDAESKKEVSNEEKNLAGKEEEKQDADKYKNLKFGEDYKIAEDMTESPVGLFERL